MIAFGTSLRWCGSPPYTPPLSGTLRTGGACYVNLGCHRADSDQRMRLAGVLVLLEQCVAPREAARFIPVAARFPHRPGETADWCEGTPCESFEQAWQVLLDFLDVVAGRRWVA